MLRTVALMLGAFATGTIAHELTHWATARLLGATVESVTLLPPAPKVVFRAPTPGVDVYVRASTVLLSLPLLVLVIWLALDRPFGQQVALAVFAAAYLPRSGSDWEPIAQWVGHAV
jgi:Zn-dependent protease